MELISDTFEEVAEIIILENTEKKRKTSEEIWDELLASSESDILLELMGNEAEKEYNEGKTEIGGWGD